MYVKSEHVVLRDIVAPFLIYFVLFCDVVAFYVLNFLHCKAHLKGLKSGVPMHGLILVVRTDVEAILMSSWLSVKMPSCFFCVVNKVGSFRYCNSANVANI